MFFPSTYPRSRSRWRKASTRAEKKDAEDGIRIPIRGILAGCWASALAPHIASMTARATIPSHFRFWILRRGSGHALDFRLSDRESHFRRRRLSFMSLSHAIQSPKSETQRSIRKTLSMLIREYPRFTKSSLTKILLDISIRRDGGGGAVAGGSDRLRDGVLPDIADGVKTITGGFHRSVRRHMSGVAKLQDTSQKLRVRLQADVNEQPGEIDVRYFSRMQFANSHAGDDVVAENFFNRGLITRDYF